MRDSIRSSVRTAAVAAAAIFTLPAGASAQFYDAPCEAAVYDRLSQQARVGIEREVRIKEQAMRPQASVRELACLDSLLSVNVNWFSMDPSNLLQMLRGQLGALVCNYARQEFSRYTQPLNSSLQIPGARSLPFMPQGPSWTVGGGRQGINVNGGNYSPSSVFGSQGALGGNPGSGTGGLGVFTGGITGTPIIPSPSIAPLAPAPTGNIAPPVASPRSTPSPMVVPEQPGGARPGALEGLFR